MPLGVATIAGSGTALMKMPPPPSIGVLRMIVAITKVTARVSSANSSPRSRRRRKTMAPMPTASSAGIAAATGKVGRNGQPNLVVRTAVVYRPTPKKAAWPRLK